MEKITVLLPGTDLNTVIESGLYRLQGDGSDFANGTDFDCGWSIMTVGGYLDTTFQEMHSLHNEIAIRMRASGVNWSKWTRLATATKPAVYDLPLAAGWGYQQKTCYFKTQDNVVTVNVAINATAVHHSGEIIATLPEGYRPMQSYEASATLKNPASAAALYIDTNGSLQNYGADISQGQMMYANISFVAA